MARFPLALALAAILAMACLPGGFDWMFVVRNDTDRTVYLLAPLSTEPAERLHRVARVPAGAQGRSVEWFGTPDNQVSILDEDCQVLGTFDRAGEPSVHVAAPAVAGVSGRVEPYRIDNARDNEPIELSGDCGGFLYV